LEDGAASKQHGAKATDEEEQELQILEDMARRWASSEDDENEESEDGSD
jgi:hypothetical protein